MRVNAILMRLRRRAADESGFTMIIAMMVLTIVTLLIGAAFVAANGDVDNSRHDLDGKRAYYSARAGLNRFLYLLNKNNELWQTCPSQATTAVPGSSGQTYSYAPLPANGQAACTTSNPVGTFIDISTGSFRMRFTGASNGVTRSIVAQFKRRSPLDYLYYSKYETLDPNTYDDPENYQDCAAFIRDGRPSKCGYIRWVTGDEINGPLYTQDQYVICGSPTFGRPGKSDTMQSAAPIPTISICGGSPTYNTPTGGPLGDAGTIDPPSDNTNLLPYAQANGKVYTGKTTITLNGTTASISNASVSGGTPQTVSLINFPIIYVTNDSGCSATYTPYFGGSSNYTSGSTCGNVFISGTYSTSITIAAANDIVLKGSMTTNLAGSAVAGLVANNFIRVMHGVDDDREDYPNDCEGADNLSSYTHPGIRIDAAILGPAALVHRRQLRLW